MAYYSKERAEEALNYLAHEASTASLRGKPGPEGWIRLLTYVKYSVDNSNHTMEECIEALKEDTDKNPRLNVEFVSNRVWTYVPCKPGPNGHKGHYKKVEGKAEIDFYSLVRCYIEMSVPFISKQQLKRREAAKERQEWLESKEAFDIANKIAGEGLNKAWMYAHYSGKKRQRILELHNYILQQDGVGLFRTEPKHSEAFNSKTQARLDSLRAKFANGERLTTADRMWMTSHKILSKDLK